MKRAAKEIFGPGMFRLILASAVFLHHTSRIAVGHAAVVVFFMLSGYWIHRMWQERYAHTDAPLTNFYVSRLWRLLPIFLVVNTIAIAINVLVGSAAIEELSGLTFLQTVHAAIANTVILGYASSPVWFTVSAWSLDIEVQFYLAAPFIVMLLAAIPLWAGLVIALAVTVASQVAIGENIVFTTYLIYFMIGMLCAAARYRPRAQVAFSGIACFALALIIFSVTPSLEPILLGGVGRSVLFKQWNQPLNLLLAAFLAPYAMWTTGRVGSVRDGLYADMAYTLYLLHWPATFLLTRYFGMLMPGQRLPYFIATWVIVYVGTYLLCRYVDRPINRLRVRFVKRKEAQGVLKDSMTSNAAPTIRNTL